MTPYLVTHKIETNYLKTAPVQIMGIKGPFQKSTVKCGKDSKLYQFIAKMVRGDQRALGPRVTKLGIIFCFIWPQFSQYLMVENIASELIC